MTPQMESSHQIFMESAQHMAQVDDQSVDLVVTSPPYPMIKLWDDQFARIDSDIGKALARNDVNNAFERMHVYLDGIWKEVTRTLKPGAIACINIGDATRSFDGHFQLFANHARIIKAFNTLGYSQLPAIIWRKPTNAPNKFMGSGMYPPGAYVTLEHEYILIFRNGAKREFNDEAQKQRRHQSAYFWEERNAWFSDVWMDLPGAPQNLKEKGGRSRSGAFPLELPFRLINMFSIRGDRVLDPFLGTGTTMQAAMCTGRNAVGYELDPDLHPLILENFALVPDIANGLVQNRLQAHRHFIRYRVKTKGDIKHQNRHYGFAVMTRQEEDLQLLLVQNIHYLSGHRFNVVYGDLNNPAASPTKEGEKIPANSFHPTTKGRQMKIF